MDGMTLSLIVLTSYVKGKENRTAYVNIHITCSSNTFIQTSIALSKIETDLG